MFSSTPKGVQRPKSFCHAALSRFVRWATKPYKVEGGQTEAAKIKEMYRAKTETPRSVGYHDKSTQTSPTLPDTAGPIEGVSGMRNRRRFKHASKEALERIEEKSDDEEGSSVYSSAMEEKEDPSVGDEESDEQEGIEFVDGEDCGLDECFVIY